MVATQFPSSEGTSRSSRSHADRHARDRQSLRAALDENFKLGLQLRQLQKLVSDFEADPVLAERFISVKQSLSLHREDCKALYLPVHHAAVAAVRVGGADTISKLAAHKEAGLAKHAELHTEKPLA